MVHSPQCVKKLYVYYVVYTQLTVVYYAVLTVDCYIISNHRSVQLLALVLLGSVVMGRGFLLSLILNTFSLLSCSHAAKQFL